MRILPISNIIYSHKNNNLGPKTVAIESKISPERAFGPGGVGLIYFTSVNHGGEKLKKLVDYDLPDMYTGNLMLNPKILEKWQQDRIFSMPLSQVVNIVGKKENVLLPVQKEFFKIMKEYAQEYPTMHLDEMIKRLQPKHNKILMSQQQPIFEELIRCATKMPEKEFSEFMELMNSTNERIMKHPVVLPFSATDFKYKLKRISLGIESRNNKEEVKAMKKLIKLSNYLFETEKFKKPYKLKKRFSIKKRVEKQLTPEIIMANYAKLKAMRVVLDNSVLKSDPELIALFEDTSAKIHGLPIIAPFKRKTFIYDLQTITNNLENQKFAHKMLKIASKLPNSSDNLSAFIVKSADSSCEKIGYDLFSGSICSVEHLKPKKSGGANTLKNFGLTCRAVNSERKNCTFEHWITIHPETAQNCQKYVDRLIELYKDGTFDKINEMYKNNSPDSMKLNRGYIEGFASTIRHLSKDKIILNLEKLND